MVKLNAGGATVCFFTGGLALAPMIAGSAAGFGLMGAGMNSLVRTQQDEYTLGDWLTSAALGFVAGAATAGIMGAGAALSTAKIGQQVGIGAIAGSVGGACQSLASDVERNLLDGEDIAVGKMLKNAACSAAIGAAVGAVGGAISSRMGGLLASTDADEVVVTAILRKSGVKALQEVSESGLGSVLNSTRKAIEERLDSTIENRRFEEHATESIKTLAKDIIVNGAAVGVAAGAAESIQCVKSRMSGVSKLARPHETCTPTSMNRSPRYKSLGSKKQDSIQVGEIQIPELDELLQELEIKNIEKV